MSRPVYQNLNADLSARPIAGFLMLMNIAMALCIHENLMVQRSIIRTGLHSHAKNSFKMGMDEPCNGAKTSEKL